jgi:hypothetical protein
MTATWFQGPATEFQKARRAGFERGVSIIHFLGGKTIDIAGQRAIAQTKMTINQRASVDGVVVDAVCTGRFYDFFASRGGRWAIVRRQPIYEKDRLDPVRATVTSGICRPKPASTCTSGFRACAARRSPSCTPKALPGSRGRLSPAYRSNASRDQCGPRR